MDGQLGSLDRQHQTAVPSQSDEMVRQVLKDRLQSLCAAVNTTDDNDTPITADANDTLIIQHLQ